MWNLEYDTMTCLQNRLTDTGNSDYPREKGVGRDKLWIWDWQIQITIYKIDKQQCPTVYSTGSYIQYPVLNHNGEEYEYIYVCITNHFTPETNTTL